MYLVSLSPLETSKAAKAGLWRLCAGGVLVLLTSGCTQNAYTLKNDLTQLQTQQTQLTQRNEELQNRANTLDKNNQELETLLAQSRQESQRLEEHLGLVREQLRGAATQLAQVLEEKQETDQKSQALLASNRRRGDAAILPNNSLQKSLPAVNVPGVSVRQDGDVIRIELPADTMFEPGTARLLMTAGPTIDGAATEIARAFPHQKIGIEGHTDADTLLAPGSVSSHQLSIARAAAIQEYLTSRGRFPASQTFLVGHGSNHPVVSNATPAGKARNRRVELVVYPEPIQQ